MSVSTESCYECGHDLPGDRGESVYACLWNLPNAGGEYWAWVQVCPSCAGARRSRRAALLVAVSLVVSALTALMAYPLLP